MPRPWKRARTSPLAVVTMGVPPGPRSMVRRRPSPVRIKLSGRSPKNFSLRITWAPALLMPEPPGKNKAGCSSAPTPWKRCPRSARPTPQRPQESCACASPRSPPRRGYLISVRNERGFFKTKRGSLPLSCRHRFQRGSGRPPWRQVDGSENGGIGAIAEAEALDDAPDVGFRRRDRHAEAAGDRPVVATEAQLLQHSRVARRKLLQRARAAGSPARRRF